MVYLQICTFPTLNQNTTGSSGSTTGNAATATTSTNVTVADESTDTSCNVLFTTAATGDLPPKSGTNLTFNSNTGILTATGFAGPLTGNVTGNTSGTAATVTGAAQTAITSVGDLTALTVDNLDIDANQISASNAGGHIELAPKTTGFLKVIGNDHDGAITLNCTNNNHGQTIKSQPHAEAASNTLLLPKTASNAQSTLVSEISTQTLTNKTLTSPVVNVTSDATGDVYYRNASGLFTRLAAGGTGTVLTIASGIPSWASPAGGGATVTHDYTIQASSYTGGAASGTTRSVFIRTIDTNNEGVFVKIKKNGTADTEVQIA